MGIKNLQPALLAAICCSLFLSPVWADAENGFDRDGIEFPSTPAESFASPQYFALEIKLGPYSPDVDSEFADPAVHPFQDLFGSGKRIMFQAEFDYQFWHGFGSVGVGFAWGYYKARAQPLADDGSNAPGDVATPGNDRRVEGRTALSLMPLSLLTIYRFDVLAQRWGIPLVPFAKIGVNYVLWDITSGDGSTANFNGDEASGGTWGWQFNLGIAFLLDILEPSAAKTMDVEVGINHSYLFFEFIRLQVDGFGSDDSLHVGDTTWVGGLALEF